MILRLLTSLPLAVCCSILITFYFFTVKPDLYEAFYYRDKQWIVIEFAQKYSNGYDA